jgi:hypothetical protein
METRVHELTMSEHQNEAITRICIVLIKEKANALRTLVDLIHSTAALWVISVFTIVDVRITKSGTFSLLRDKMYVSSRRVSKNVHLS